MTDSFDTAPDPRDRPNQAPAPNAMPAQPEPPARRVAPRPRGGFGRLLRWWLATSVVVLLACVVCVAIGVSQFDLEPLHIVIDGDDVTNGVMIQGLSLGGQVLLAIGALLVGLLVLLLVPALILLVLAIVAMALAVALVAPLLGLVVALVAVSSPLWIVGGLVWLIARDRHPVPRPAPSATMNA